MDPEPSALETFLAGTLKETIQQQKNRVLSFNSHSLILGESEVHLYKEREINKALKAGIF